ncbi:MAG: hydrogenase maturation protease [Spirochaetales bacterium]|nr:hydrogenase maturation protease [Spirochaetales bacterium]
MRKEIAVIGVGNTLFGDEGVGVHALSELKKLYRSPHVEYIEGGTLGIGMLHVCEGRKKIIVIDGGMCGEKPGNFRRFERHEVESLKETKGYSLHVFDPVELLAIADELGMLENTDCAVYCMEIERMEMSESLSSPVKKGLPLLVKAVYDELKSAGAAIV